MSPCLRDVFRLLKEAAFRVDDVRLSLSMCRHDAVEFLEPVEYNIDPRR
jgi:hypothetical protein